MATTFDESCYRYKKNCIERAPTDEEKQNLQYPKDKFDLISVDKVYEWDQPRTQMSNVNKGEHKTYIHRCKSVWLTVRCKRCGDIKKVADNPRMGCKQGPCHQKFVDWTGKKVNKLTPLRYIKTAYRKGGREKWYWECRCDCGELTLALENQLHYGTKLGCEKCSRESSAKNNTLPNDLSKWHRWFRVLKKNAICRGFDIELTFEEAKAIASTGVCHYCGAEPELTSYGIKVLGIDRLDSSRGYVHGNVVPCCGRCNVMKRTDTEAEFLDRIRKIAQYRKLTFNDYPEKEYIQADGNGGHPEKGEDIV